MNEEYDKNSQIDEDTKQAFNALAKKVNTDENKQLITECMITYISQVIKNLCKYRSPLLSIAFI